MCKFITIYFHYDKNGTRPLANVHHTNFTGIVIQTKKEGLYLGILILHS